MPTGDDYAKTHAYGAVALLMGRTHYRVSSKLGPKEFVPFLRHLLAYHSGKQLLVMHGQGAQYTGAAVENVVREARGRLMLKAQPACSPEFNPQECIWKWLRRMVTHSHWFTSLHKQIEAIRNCFRYLAGIKD
jgi:transposase